MRKPYKPNGLVRPTAEELRNGWTPERLTDFIKGSCSTDYEFRRELLMRSKDLERITHAAVLKFRKLEDMDLAKNQAKLAELEREAAEAGADAAYATDRFVEADGVAA